MLRDDALSRQVDRRLGQGNQEESREHAACDLGQFKQIHHLFTLDARMADSATAQIQNSNYLAAHPNLDQRMPLNAYSQIGTGARTKSRSEPSMRGHLQGHPLSVATRHLVSLQLLQARNCTNVRRVRVEKNSESALPVPWGLVSRQTGFLLGIRGAHPADTGVLCQTRA